MPWKMRTISSRAGAQYPTASKVGRMPMMAVEMPISMKVTIRVFFRPIWSPIAPKIIPPSGRAMKPTANVTEAWIVANCESPAGKKTLAMTMEAMEA
jgi:hypothetical protein